MGEILKLYPAFKDYLWGGEQLKETYDTDMSPLAEAWVLSTHKDGNSIVTGGKYDGKSLADAIKDMGKDALGKKAQAFEMFPILIKIIDAKQKLSIQVHPDDSYALKNEGQYGKSEMWYILDAKENGGIYYGVKESLSKEEFINAIEEGSLEEKLSFIKVKKGESYFIPAGTVHAIGEGLLIAEIQQNSNITYRVYDYNRVGADGKKRDLHIQKAAEVSCLSPADIKYEGKVRQRPYGSEQLLTSCPYFETKKVICKGEITLKTQDSFISLFVAEGSGEIDGVPFKKYDTFFIPASKKETNLYGSFTVLISDCP